MPALPRSPPWRSSSSICPAASRPKVDRMRAVIVPPASICATVTSPCGEIRGLALEAWLCGDLALRKPAFVGGEDRGDQASCGPDDLGVAADGVRVVDQVQDGVDAVGGRGGPRI